jgi:hypothetical protein
MPHRAVGAVMHDAPRLRRPHSVVRSQPAGRWDNLPTVEFLFLLNQRFTCLDETI